jgi:hypothetical protein
MLPKRDLLWMLMLPKRVPLQIYVQETLQKFARFFTVYIIAQIAAFHGCEHPASLDDHSDSRSRLLFHFLSGSCVLHHTPTQQLAYYVAAIKFQYCIYISDHDLASCTLVNLNANDSASKRKR